MIQHREYFEWLFDLVCGKRYAKEVSFRKLLIFLHETEFEYSIPNDANRARDGISLRHRFSLSFSDPVPEGPCSVLEMMVALAIRCEEDIADDPQLGDRTGQWFWGMVVNLGLGSMIDSRFDEELAKEIVYRFLDREYEPDGRGGLFTIRDIDRDLRKVEIWYQMCWYVNHFL